MSRQARLIARMARARGLDPRAVLSIASVEGGFHGSVGDGGTSFGPFQLHKGGALPSRHFGDAQRWANSPAGIRYALDGIGRVARGLHGRSAVSAISQRFERPADPSAEIERAMGLYGHIGGQAGGSGGGISHGTGATMPTFGQQAGTDQQLVAQQSNIHQAIASMMLQSASQGGQMDPFNLMSLAAAKQQLSQSQSTFGNVGHATANPMGAGSPIGAGGRTFAGANGVIRTAAKYLGTPYKWGGANPKTGFDCSGLVQWAYAQHGIQIPRTTYEQVHAGHHVSRQNLRPGDILFFEPGSNGPEHEGMFIGHGRFIESPHTGANVRISRLAGRSDYVTARRIGRG